VVCVWCVLVHYVQILQLYHRSRLVLICFLAFSYAQVATNTTDFPQNGNVQPENRQGDKYAVANPPPAGGEFAGQPVVADSAAIASLPQGAIGVFFVNGEPKWGQNLPQNQVAQGFTADPKVIDNKTLNCFNGKEDVGERCDYSTDTCCDVKSDCTKWLPDGSKCSFPGDTSIKKTSTNLQCFNDVCRSNTNPDLEDYYEDDETICTREKIEPLKVVEKIKKFNKNKKKKCVVSFKVCFNEVKSSRKFDTRFSKKKNGKGNKKKKCLKETDLDSSNVYCDGNGVCPCKTCSQDAVLA